MNLLTPEPVARHEALRDAVARALAPTQCRDDLLQRDLEALGLVMSAIAVALAAEPGLMTPWQRVSSKVLATRGAMPADETEAAVEALVRKMLGGHMPLPPLAGVFAGLMADGNLGAVFAPPDYRPLQMPGFWPDPRL